MVSLSELNVGRRSGSDFRRTWRESERQIEAFPGAQLDECPAFAHSKAGGDATYAGIDSNNYFLALCIGSGDDAIDDDLPTRGAPDDNEESRLLRAGAAPKALHCLSVSVRVLFGR